MPRPPPPTARSPPLDPDVPVVNFRLADALLRSGRAAESIPYYRKVIASSPRTADPFVGLATAYAGLGRMDDAARALGEAARRSRQRPGALQPRARSRACAATSRRARRAYQAALATP